jgi:hypothetical protein
MWVRVEYGGGWQETEYVVDTVPRVGETIRIGDWDGEVAKVTHVAVRNASGRVYRGENDPAVVLELSGSHRFKSG